MAVLVASILLHVVRDAGLSIDNVSAGRRTAAVGGNGDHFGEMRSVHMHCGWRSPRAAASALCTVFVHRGRTEVQGRGEFGKGLCAGPPDHIAMWPEVARDRYEQ
jgi:hypothetical protein